MHGRYTTHPIQQYPSFVSTFTYLGSSVLKIEDIKDVQADANPLKLSTCSPCWEISSNTEISQQTPSFCTMPWYQSSSMMQILCKSWQRGWMGSTSGHSGRLKGVCWFQQFYQGKMSADSTNHCIPTRRNRKWKHLAQERPILTKLGNICCSVQPKRRTTLTMRNEYPVHRLLQLGGHSGWLDIWLCTAIGEEGASHTTQRLMWSAMAAPPTGILGMAAVVESQ